MKMKKLSWEEFCDRHQFPGNYKDCEYCMFSDSIVYSPMRDRFICVQCGETFDYRFIE